MFNNQSTSESSYLSETCQIEGNLTSTGSVQVAGMIDGNIKSEQLAILDTGLVKGNITSHRIEIEGQVNGNIEGNNIFLASNAIVKGDITFFETLKTEEGADVDGYIKKSKKNINRNTESEKNQESQKKFQKPTLVKDVDQAV